MNSVSPKLLKSQDHYMYLGASNKCSKKLFNLRVPTIAEIRDYIHDDDKTVEDTVNFIKKILN